MDVQLNSGNLTAHLRVSHETFLHQVSSDANNVLQNALESPLGLPPVHQCVVPGDRVAIVVDPQTPQLTEVINQVWEQLQVAVIADLDVTLLLPTDSSGRNWNDIVDELPVHFRNQVSIQIHDPADEQQCHYLASSAGGDRIYLSHYLVDADLVVTIGVIAFDPLLGIRGTNSAVFPAMSNSESIRSARGLGDVEPTADGSVPFRELVDEIGWLLGTQFAVQVIPDSGGKVGFAFCGAMDQVLAAGKSCLQENWLLEINEPVELVIVSVPATVPQLAWKQFAAAVTAASRIVEDGGRIAVVADLPEPDSPSFQMLRRSPDPNDLLTALSAEPGEDSLEVCQVIAALQGATLLLYSQLSGQLVEELGIIPLTSEAELHRLAESTRRSAILPSANTAWTSVALPAT